VETLAKIPVIQIDPYENPTTLISEVVIPCAIAGVEAEGTAYRMDGMALLPVASGWCPGQGAVIRAAHIGQ